MPVSVLKNPMLYELSLYAIQNIVAQKHMLLDKLHCRTYYYFIQIQSERFAKSISNLIDSKSLCCSIHLPTLATISNHCVIFRYQYLSCQLIFRREILHPLFWVGTDKGQTNSQCMRQIKP